MGFCRRVSVVQGQVVLGYGTDCKPGLTRGFPDVVISFFGEELVGLVG